MSSGYKGKRAAHAGRAAVIAAVVAAAVLILAAAVAAVRGRTAPGPAQTDVLQQSEVATGSPGSGSSSQDSSAAPAQDDPAGSSASSPAEAQPPEVQTYDFSQPAPESEAVDVSYFKDAAFVGDSRTNGFMLYSGIGTGRDLTSNGLSIFKLAEKKALTINGEKYTLLEALALEQYGKVYLSLGVNELGVQNDAGFYSSYCEAVDAIRAIQPGAVIYIQGLIPLNEKQIEEHNGNKYNLTNEHLRVYNELLRQVAEEKQVVYLDLYAEFVDENEELPEGVSRDGVHLKKEACQQWLEYLKTHTVEFDTLYPDGPPPAEPAGPDTAEESVSE